MRTLSVLLVALALAVLPPLPAYAVAPAAGDETVPRGEGAWPLSPRPPVVEGFDPPQSRWGAGHRGVDLRGRAGQPVRAALPGTVTLAAVLAGRGVVVVDHGATRTTYEPVAALVGVGDQVDAGQVIGRLELRASHCVPAACLHWGWRRGDAYLDPLALVGATRVRLLPWAGSGAVATPRGGRPAEGSARVVAASADRAAGRMLALATAGARAGPG